MQFKHLVYAGTALGLAGIGSWLWLEHGHLEEAATPRPTTSIAVTEPPARPVKSESIALPATPFGAPSEQNSAEFESAGTESRVDPLEQLKILLADGRYGEAIELYDELYNTLNEEESRLYRRTILNVAGKLTAENQHGAAANLMGRYTHLFFKDLPALRRLADSLHTLKQYPTEVETILLALNEAHLEQDITEFKYKLEGAIAAQDLLFIEQSDPYGAIEFRRSLALERPDSIPYQLGLARALVNAGNVTEATELLEALPESVEFEGKIDRLKQIAEATRPQRKNAIPLIRAGNGFVVEAAVNGGSKLRLLIDTGATLTIIRPAALQRVGIGPAQFAGQTKLDTVGGRVDASVYRISSLSLGPETVANVSIGSVDIPGLGGIDGLLGMNVLGKFEFTIDHTDQVMVLTR
jgi:clan AA aspartic protease (TIGR02281 family)